MNSTSVELGNLYGVTSHTVAVWLVSKLATRPPCG